MGSTQWGMVGGQIRHVRWLSLVRSLLYVGAIAFVFQHALIDSEIRIYAPATTIAMLVTMLALNLASIPVLAANRGGNPLIVFLFAGDFLALTWLVMVSGGFNSVFISYYLLLQVIGPVWLPRRYTALFPSLATLGAALTGALHITAAEPNSGYVPNQFNGALAAFKGMSASTAVGMILILSVSYFIVAYLSGILSERLTLERRLNEEVLSGLKEGVAVVNGRGELVYANAEITRLLPLLGKTSPPSPLEVIVPGEAERRLLAERIDDGHSSEVIMTRPATPDSPPLEIRVSAMPSGPQAGGMLFLAVDLTLRQRAEAAERSLERYAALSTMAAGLAHEIRNPLASVRSAMQEIGRDFGPESPNGTLIQVVIEESDRLDGIIGRFLRFSREETMTFISCRLGKILREIKVLLEHSKYRRDTAILLEIRGDPEIFCDSERLHEVFLNLGLNALQAMGGHGKLEIVCQPCRSDGDFLEIAFADDGPGLAADAIDRVFEPFFTLKEEGSGLGLSLARKTIEGHGGTIDCSNRPEGGALFRVRLPLNLAKVAARSARVGRTSSATRIYVRNQAGTET